MIPGPGHIGRNFDQLQVREGTLLGKYIGAGSQGRSDDRSSLGLVEGGMCNFEIRTFKVKIKDISLKYRSVNKKWSTVTRKKELF